MRRRFGLVVYPHRIRLRDPWECEDLGPRKRFRRRFGFPGRIDDYERVWLTFVGIVGPVEVHLNGTFLGRGDPADGTPEFEVTELLGQRNELLLEVEGSGHGDVAMEVRCAAFLRNVRFWVEFHGEKARLHAAGEVAGRCEQALELYLVLDRSSIAYQALPPGAAPTTFHLVGDERTVTTQECPVKLELVNGAVAWYTLEQLVVFRPEK